MISNQLAQKYGEPKYWLLGIAVGLMAVNLTLTWRSDNVDVMGTSLLFWGCVAVLIWERKDDLRLDSGLFSSFAGVLIIALVMLKSATVSGYDIFLRVAPLMSGLGIGLLASGAKGLKQYWQEMLMLGFIAIPPGLVLRVVDTAPATAKFSGFLLWYLGADVTREGIYLILPEGSVEVATGCNGLNLILQLLGLSMLVLLMFPTKRIHKIIVPAIATIIAFVVNAARVALLAAIVSSGNNKAFVYWHHGDGSLIFSTIAVLIFGAFCWVAILREEPENKEAESKVAGE